MPTELRKFTPIPAAEYVPQQAPVITDQGKPVDIDYENRLVSQFLQFRESTEPGNLIALLVPGFASRKTRQLHPKAIKRLKRALGEMSALKGAVVVVSGGNVSPKNTPFNEALEMKKWLLNKGVPEYRIAIEPHAQNSVDNLMYTGRFLRSHHIAKATVITSLVHNLYLGLPHLSTFHLRSYFLKGETVGSINLKNCYQSRFQPKRLGAP